MPEPNAAEGSQPIPCLPPGAVMVADVLGYYSQIKVARVKVREGEGNDLMIGDTIMYDRGDDRGGDKWKKRIVDSIQENHNSIDIARVGMEVGIYIGEPVRPGSVIYRLPKHM